MVSWVSRWVLKWGYVSTTQISLSCGATYTCIYERELTSQMTASTAGEVSLFLIMGRLY